MNETRGTGITTQQMRAAPHGAVYVWCNSHLGYPKGLARAIGREDLDIRSPGWLTCQNVAGREFSGVIIDHALVRMNDAQLEAVLMIDRRIARTACVRRPAVAVLAKELREQHPDWSMDRCVIEAKARVTEGLR